MCHNSPKFPRSFDQLISRHLSKCLTPIMCDHVRTLSNGALFSNTGGGSPEGGMGEPSLTWGSRISWDENLHGGQGKRGQEGDRWDQPCPSFISAGHSTVQRPGFLSVTGPNGPARPTDLKYTKLRFKVGRDRLKVTIKRAESWC